MDSINIRRNGIGIIVPVYHGKRYIENMIGQVEKCVRKLGKEYAVELLLINDAPDEMLGQYSSETMDIIAVNTDCNRGIHGARVRGLRICRSEYITFLDQDDRIAPDYLASQVAAIGEADAAVCRCIHEKKLYYNADHPFERMINKNYMLTSGCPIISTGQLLIRKKAIPEVWCDNIMHSNCADDYYLYLCMAGRGSVFALNQEVLFEHVVDGNNTSWDMNRMMASEHEMIGLLKKSCIFEGEDLRLLNRLEDTLREIHMNVLTKFRKMFMVINNWLELKEEGYLLDRFLYDRGIRSLAVYGAGYVGKRLKGELKQGLVSVDFFIDRNAAYITEDIPVYTLEEAPYKVDAVIVSLVQGYEGVVRQIKQKYITRVMVIGELVAELSNLQG